MSSEIEQYWDEFTALQDGLISDWDSVQSKRDARDAVMGLMKRVSEDISERRHALTQLSFWMATFYSLVAQISVDLSEYTEAIAAYELSLDNNYDAERAVWLIEILCDAGRIDEAAIRIKELCDKKVSFSQMRDIESATRLLQVVGSHSRLAETVEPCLLRDLLVAISTRGINSLSLNECV